MNAYKRFFTEEVLEGNPPDRSDDGLLKWKKQAVRVRKIPAHLQNLYLAIAISFIDGYIYQEFLTFHDKIYQFVESFIKQIEEGSQRIMEPLLGNVNKKVIGNNKSINTLNFTRDDLIKTFLKSFEDVRVNNEDVNFLEEAIITEVNVSKRCSPIKKQAIKITEGLDLAVVQKICDTF